MIILDIGFAIALTALADRAMPMSAWGHLARVSTKTEQEVMLQYGLVSFPRTLIAAIFVIAFGLSRAFHSIILDAIALILMVLYLICAGFDTWRAIYR